MIPAGSFFESAPDRGHIARQSATVSLVATLVCRRIALPSDYKSHVRSILPPRVLPPLGARLWPVLSDGRFLC